MQRGLLIRARTRNSCFPLVQLFHVHMHHHAECFCTTRIWRYNKQIGAEKFVLQVIKKKKRKQRIRFVFYSDFLAIYVEEEMKLGSRISRISLHEIKIKLYTSVLVQCHLPALLFHSVHATVSKCSINSNRCHLLRRGNVRFIELSVRVMRVRRTMLSVYSPQQLLT